MICCHVKCVRVALVFNYETIFRRLGGSTLMSISYLEFNQKIFIILIDNDYILSDDKTNKLSIYVLDK